jgi:hypothetical protein
MDSKDHEAACERGLSKIKHRSKLSRTKAKTAYPAIGRPAAFSFSGFGPSFEDRMQKRFVT